MRPVTFAMIGLLLLSGNAAANDAQGGLSSHRERTSYALGVNLVGNLRQQDLDVDLEQVIRGMRDASSGGTLAMTDEEVRTYISKYQSEVRLKQAALKTAAAAANKKAEVEFFAANGKKEGVVTRPSGLQYRIVSAGKGKIPGDADTVVCRYRATTLSGVEFESSFRKGTPAVFKVRGGAIAGLSEALKLMPEGSHWQLFIPARLAYGERGIGSQVGPNEGVVFDLELVAIR